jgi:glycerol uptake facilitator-like aquaporin
MRKSLPYEIIAAASAMLGALILVWVYYPILNPIQYSIDSHQDLPSISYYIVMTPIPLAILWASSHFNKKAQQLKQDEKHIDGGSDQG